MIKSTRKALSILLSLLMILSTVTVGFTNVWAEDGETDSSTGELVHTKVFEPDENDPNKGTLKLEAYLTGETVISAKPVDIVLVLDLSSSMLVKMPSADQTVSPKSLTIGGGPYYRFTTSGYTDTFTEIRYNEEEGSWGYQDTFLFFPYWNPLRDDWIITTVDGDAVGNEDVFDTRLDILKNAIAGEGGFLDKIYASAIGEDETAGTEDDVAHRVSIVTFGSDAKTESNFTVVNGNLASLKAKVNGLNTTTGNGRWQYTNSGAGMTTAQTILAADTNDNAKTVVMFTDGVPTSTGGSYNDATAKEAIDAAQTIKKSVEKGGCGATVFTVGVFDETDASDKDKTDLYMNYVSSNYPNANVDFKEAQGRWDSDTYTYNSGLTGDEKPSDAYYMTADSPEKLNEIFTAIAVDSGKSDYTAETILRDVISKSFDLPEGADASAIKATIMKYIGEGTYTAADFAEPGEDDTEAAEILNKIKVSLSEDGKTIDVTGFDYKANFCGRHIDIVEGVPGEPYYAGYKIVVEIPIVRNSEEAGGEVNTNDPGSGIVTPGEDEPDPGADFPQPIYDIPVSLTLNVAAGANDGKEAHTITVSYQKCKTDEDGKLVYENVAEGDTTHYKLTPEAATETIEVPEGYTTSEWKIENIYVGSVTITENNVNKDYTVTIGDDTALTPTDGVVTKTFDLTGTKTVTVTNSTTKTYTVTFKDGVTGNEIKNETVYAGNKLTAAQIPSTEKAGYTFNGWLEGEKNIDTDTFRVKAATTLTADYTPNESTYNVEFYKQKLDGVVTDYTNGYEIDSSMTLSGEKALKGNTGETTNYTADPITGFTVAKTENVTITADGKATVKVYYSRDSYTVTFENIQEDTKSYSYLYGATVDTTKVTANEKDGYKFTKWQYRATGTDTALADLEGATVETNMTVYPSYESLPDEYNIQYIALDFNDQIDEKATPFHTVSNIKGSNVGDSVTAPELEGEAAKDLIGYTYDAVKSAATVSGTVAYGGTTTLIRYYKRNIHTVTFNYDGGTAEGKGSSTATVKFGQTITFPTPTKTGYNYTDTGWIISGAQDKTAAPAQLTVDNDLTLQPDWVKNKHKLIYNYYVQNATPNEDATYGYGELQTKEVELEYGDTVDTLWTIENFGTGFEFTKNEGGWLTAGEDGEVFTSITMGDEDINLFAHFDRKVYTVNIYAVRETSDGRTIETLINSSAPYGTKITAIETDITGYTKGEWFGAPEGWMMPADAVNIRRVYIPIEYTLSYELDGNAYGEAEKVKFDSEVTLKADPENRTGYTFSGWKKGNEAAPATFKMPADDLTIKGKFNINQYTFAWAITSDNKALEDSLSDTVDYAKEISVPTPDEAEGYYFSGWTYEGITAEDITEGKFAMPDNDVTLTGEYIIEKYNVVYKIDGETVKTIQNVPYGAAKETYEYGDAPTAEGKTFSGWSDIPETMPDAGTNGDDFEIVGSFDPNTYNLVYDYQNGSQNETKQIVYENPFEEPTTTEPTKTGYTFAGWKYYKVEEGKEDTEIDKPVTMPAYNVKAVAQWTINQYSIVFDANGGAFADADTAKTLTQDYNTDVTFEEVPTREGYTFDGWGPIPKKMPATENETRTLTIKATWKINSYKVTYKAQYMELDGETYSEAAELTELSDTKVYNSEVTIAKAPNEEGFTAQTAVTVTGATATDGKFTMPAGDVTVTFKYTRNKYTVQYLLDSAVYKGDAYPEKGFYFGQKLYVEADPEKTGYKFEGWTTTNVTLQEDGEGKKFFTVPAKDVVITGSFTVRSYSIVYKLNGYIVDGVKQADGYEYKDYAGSCNYDAEVVLKDALTQTDYDFSGWVPQGIEEADDGKYHMPAEPLVILGTFTPTEYTATFTKTVTNAEGRTKTPTSGVSFATKTYTVESDFETVFADIGAPENYDHGDYEYSFKGWNKEFAFASGGTTYAAEYDKTFVKATAYDDLLPDAVAEAEKILQENADVLSDKVKKAIEDLIAECYKDDEAEKDEDKYYGITEEEKVEGLINALTAALTDLFDEETGELKDDYRENIKVYFTYRNSATGEYIEQPEEVEVAAGRTAEVPKIDKAFEVNAKTYTFLDWKIGDETADLEQEVLATFTAKADYKIVDYTAFDEAVDKLDNEDLDEEIIKELLEQIDDINEERKSEDGDENTEDELKDVIDEIEKLFDEKGNLKDEYRTEYTVTFKFYKNGDVTDFATEDVKVKSGKDAPAPEIDKAFEADKVTYTFTKWDKAFTNVTGDLTVTAQYKTVDYNAFDEAVDKLDNEDLDEEIIKELLEQIDDINEERKSEDGDDNTEDKLKDVIDEIEKLFDEDGNLKDEYRTEYTVTFKFYKDCDVTDFATEDVKVKSGKNAPAPEIDKAFEADKVTYTFTEWDKAFTNVTGDLTVTALYKTVDYNDFDEAADKLDNEDLDEEMIEDLLEKIDDINEERKSEDGDDNEQEAIDEVKDLINDLFDEETGELKDEYRKDVTVYFNYRDAADATWIGTPEKVTAKSGREAKPANMTAHFEYGKTTYVFKNWINTGGETVDMSSVKEEMNNWVVSADYKEVKYGEYETKVAQILAQDLDRENKEVKKLLADIAAIDANRVDKEGDKNEQAQVDAIGANIDKMAENIESFLKQYTVTFMNGGETFAIVSGTKGYNALDKLAEVKGAEKPVKAYDRASHYVFTEWTNKDALKSIATDGLTVYAQYKAVAHTYVESGENGGNEDYSYTGFCCSTCGAKAVKLTVAAKNSKGEPLQGAKVTVTDKATGEVVSNGTTGRDGKFTTGILFEGTYKISVLDEIDWVTTEGEITIGKDGISCAYKSATGASNCGKCACHKNTFYGKLLRWICTLLSNIFNRPIKCCDDMQYLGGHVGRFT